MEETIIEIHDCCPGIGDVEISDESDLVGGIVTDTPDMSKMREYFLPCVNFVHLSQGNSFNYPETRLGHRKGMFSRTSWKPGASIRAVSITA
jgi:hypothetical protein